jgi:anthranilate synthase component 1
LHLTALFVSGEIMKTEPSISEFKRMTGTGNLVPVWSEFLADTETPVSAYLKLRDDSCSYLLESAERGEKWGRYSFIGCTPHVIVASRGQEVEIWEGGKRTTLDPVSNPLHVLRRLCAKYRPAVSDRLPPFQGGLVGYVHYDLIRKWERLPSVSAQETEAPECMFIFCRRMIVFDHLTHRIMVVAYAFADDGRPPEEAYDAARREVREVIGRLEKPLPSCPQSPSFRLSRLESNFTRERFEGTVQSAKEYIAAGEAIQVVLSQRFSGRASGDDFQLYRSLRSVNPSPYMFYLNYGETRMIGASPEILARLTDGKIEVRPIAGTRPRGRSPHEDRAFEEELLADPKERAEHVMLVDLGRNDVARVSLPGSVGVPGLMEVERYSHVMHIVSRVEGRLKEDADAFDLFMATFPAGTVSGAPKIRAMEIISALEPSPRGPYAGAVGYFDFNGNMDFCITIRTICIHGDRLSIQVGAGIVADSSPAGEYEETLRKGEAMFKAIERIRTT